MSCAPTSRRGLPLNCRLLVKGIQKASRLLGEASKFATSTVELMAGSADGDGWPDITSDRRRRQTGGGLDHQSRWNWPEGRKRREDPMLSGERGAQGRAGEQVSGA